MVALWSYSYFYYLTEFLKTPVKKLTRFSPPDRSQITDHRTYKNNRRTTVSGPIPRAMGLLERACAI